MFIISNDFVAYDHVFSVKNNYVEKSMLRRKYVNTLKKVIKYVTLYFLLKPSLSDVHQVFICSYAVTTLWVKVATVQSAVMFRLLLNITVASKYSSLREFHKPFVCNIITRKDLNNS